MTVTELREHIRPRWVNSMEVDWVASALPAHHTSIATPDTMDEVGQELTSALHAITTPSGKRWLVGTDLYRIHAVHLEETCPLPNGSYRHHEEGWIRFPTGLDLSKLAPYLATQERVEPPLQLNLSARAVERITGHQEDHPGMVLFLRNGLTQLHRAWDDLRLIEAFDARPVIGRNEGKETFAVQWPVMRPAVESGMTRWHGPGGIGPWRSDKGRRTAVVLGINIAAPVLEVSA